MRASTATFGDFARYYADAADALVQRYAGRGGARSRSVYPVVYLYRHALELGLKDANIWVEACIAAQAEMGLVSVAAVRDFADARAQLRTHRLEPLLERLVTRLSFLSETVVLSDDLLPIVRFVDRLDRSGQGLRYPYVPAKVDAEPDEIEGVTGVEAAQALIGPAITYLTTTVADSLRSILVIADAEFEREDAQELYLAQLAAEPPPDEWGWEWPASHQISDNEFDEDALWERAPEMRIDWNE